MKKTNTFYLFVLFAFSLTSNAQISSGIEPPLSDIKNAYVQLVRQYADNEKDQDFPEDFYFLFDITNDGIPELWIRTGIGESDYTLKTYTYNNGASKKIFETHADHCRFHAGDNYIIRAWGMQGWGIWTKIYYDGNSIVEEDIFEESLNNEYGDPIYNEHGELLDYKQPDEKYIPTHDVRYVDEINNVFHILELHEQLKAKERAILLSRKSYPDSSLVQVIPAAKKNFKWLFGTWYNRQENQYVVITHKYLRFGKTLGSIFSQIPLKLTNVKNHPGFSEYIIINDGDSLNLYVDKNKQTLFSEDLSEDGQPTVIINWERKNTYAAIITKLVLIIVGIALGICALITSIFLLTKHIKKFKKSKINFSLTQQDINSDIHLQESLSVKPNVPTKETLQEREQHSPDAHLNSSPMLQPNIINPQQIKKTNNMTQEEKSLQESTKNSNPQIHVVTNVEGAVKGASNAGTSLGTKQKIKTVQPYKLLKILFSDRSTAKSKAIKAMVIIFVVAFIPSLISGDVILPLIIIPILLLLCFPLMIYNPMLKDEYIPKESYTFIRKLAKKELPSIFYNKEDEELRMFHSDVDYNTNVDLNETFGVNDKLIISYQNFDFEKQHMENGDYLLGVSAQSLYCVYKNGTIMKTKMDFNEIDTIGLMFSIPNAYILQVRNKKNEEINAILYQSTSLVVYPLLFINSILDALDNYLENGGLPVNNSSRRRVVINKGESSSTTSNKTETSSANRNIDMGVNHDLKGKMEQSSSSRVVDLTFTNGILEELAGASYVDSNRKIEL